MTENTPDFSALQAEVEADIATLSAIAKAVEDLARGRLQSMQLSPIVADAVDTLREFVRDVKSGRANFTQTVTSADGVKKRISSGSFEFARPNRFRFAYAKPFEQVIVSDGQKVWIFDADLNQASSRKLTEALGASPAALLTGGERGARADVGEVMLIDAGIMRQVAAAAGHHHPLAVVLLADPAVAALRPTASAHAH